MGTLSYTKQRINVGHSLPLLLSFSFFSELAPENGAAGRNRLPVDKYLPEFPGRPIILHYSSAAPLPTLRLIRIQPYCSQQASVGHECQSQEILAFGRMRFSHISKPAWIFLYRHQPQRRET